MMIKTYCKIADGQIVKIRHADDSDSVLIPKLMAHGYLEAEDDPPPTNPVTQRLTNDGLIVENSVPKYKYTIWEDIRPDVSSGLYENVLGDPEWLDQGKMVRNWIRTAKPLSEAKIIKRAMLKQEALELFQGKYDYFTILNFVADYTQDKTQLKADYNTVKDYFILKRNEVNSCTTVAEIIAISVAWPEI